MTVKEQKITISEREVRYLESEPKETRREARVPLIILHGWGSSIASWRKVAQGLEESGQKVFVPDLPGFGESEEPPASWSLADYTDFIKSFKDALGISKFILAGHSFGGQIAIAFAAKDSGDLLALVLLGAARVARRKKMRVKIFEVFTAIGSPVFALAPLSFLRPVFQKLWYSVSRERDYYKASPLMKETMKRVLEEEVGEKLATIKTPTLILWGEKDKATPLADASIIKSKIPGSKLYIFPNAGHAINLEAPRELAEKIIEFIDRL